MTYERQHDGISSKLINNGIEILISCLTPVMGEIIQNLKKKKQKQHKCYFIYIRVYTHTHTSLIPLYLHSTMTIKVYSIVYLQRYFENFQQHVDF